MSSKDFKSLSQTLSPDIYRQFKTSIETGKWPDGREVNREQRDLMMEAVILYEHANMPAEKHLGAMSDQCQSSSNDGDSAHDDTQKITLQ